jgi:hypothetical protein
MIGCGCALGSKTAPSTGDQFVEGAFSAEHVETGKHLVGGQP